LSTTYSDDCPLCQAAKTWDEESPEIELPIFAKDKGVPAALLRRRLGIGSARHTWDANKIGILQDMANDGLTVQEMSEEFNISKVRMGQLIKQHNIDMAAGRVKRARREAALAAEAAEQILAVYHNNPLLTPDQIAHEVPNGTKAMVEQILKAMNLSINRDASKKMEEQDEDVVEVEQYEEPVPIHGERSHVDWVAAYLAAAQDEGEEPTFEGFGNWSKPRGGPTTTDVRHEVGSWKEAKRLASALL